MARRTPFVVFDANEITEGVWQGSYPEEGTLLRDSGFGAVVLCAKGFQPPASRFPGVDVIHAPALDDRHNALSRETLQRALATAKQVVARVQDGKNVLVTCQAGLNRSGLVSALSLHLLYGWDGPTCVACVQKGRDGALFNEKFVEALNRMKSTP